MYSNYTHMYTLILHTHMHTHSYITHTPHTHTHTHAHSLVFHTFLDSTHQCSEQLLRTLTPPSCMREATWYVVAMEIILIIDYFVLELS